MDLGASVPDDDDEFGDYVLRAEKSADFQAATLRYGRAMHPGNLPGPTSVVEKYTEAQIDSLRQQSRASVLALQQEFAVTPPADMLFEKGDTLSLRQLIAGREISGAGDMKFGGDRVAPQPGPEAPIRAGDRMVTIGGSPMIAIGGPEMVTIGSQRDQTNVVVGQTKGSLLVHLGDDEEEEKEKYPSMPKRQTTLVDSLSLISLLNQPRPLRQADVDSVFARVGRKDGFAAAAFGNAPPSMILPATADEAKRILNHELGVDLTFQGYDFARPADVFGARTKPPPLDAPRQKLVEGLVSWAVASAAAHHLDPEGTFDLHSPGGFTGINRSFRDPVTGISEQVGRLRAGVGEVISPYMLDVKDPLLDILFPGGTPRERADHPVQGWFYSTGNFLLDFILPGSNVRDVTGRHWLPVDGIKTATYRTIDNFRKEFGAPLMVDFLTDDAMIRAVSVNPHPTPEGYTRGMFGMNPFGKEIDRWSAIRGAQALGVATNPVLSPTSTMSNPQLWGGLILDPYTNRITDIQPLFRFSGISQDPKTGKVKFNAPHVSLFQLDHVVPLSYAWQHGMEQMMEEAYQLFDDDVGQEGKGFHRALRHGDIRVGAGGSGGEAMPPVSANTQKALAIMEAISRIGYAANPNQYALVAASLNQAKGDKGPGKWLPYGWARTQAEHDINAAYVARWRSIMETTRKDMAAVVGPDPNFFLPGRDDELAMRRVELGLDTENRFLRPFGQAFVEYFDSPNLVDPTLHQSIRAWIAVGEAGFATKLVTWSLIPWSQIYMTGREYLAQGVWAHMFPRAQDPWKTFRSLSTARSRATDLGGWFRDRMAGVPLLGRKQLALYGDEAIFTLHDLARSGRVEEVLRHFPGDEVPSFVSSRMGPVYLARPDQLRRYVTGAPDAFGPAMVRAPRPWENGRLPAFSDEVRGRYVEYLRTGDDQFLPRATEFRGLSEAQRAHWSGELSMLERAQDHILAVGPQQPEALVQVEAQFIHKELLGAIRQGLRDEYEVSTTSQLGREVLQAIPFGQEFLEAVRHGKVSEASWLLGRQLLVKGTDYASRAAMGVGGGFSNLSPDRFVGILAMETIATTGGKYTGSTVARRLPFAKMDFGESGDVFGWLREVRRRDEAEEAMAREELERVQEASRALGPRPSVALADRSMQELTSLGDQLSPGETFLARDRMRFAQERLDEYQRARSQLAARAQEARSALRNITRRGREFSEALHGEGLSWLEEVEAMRGFRGSLMRFAVQHPRATSSVMGVAAVPLKLKEVVRAPFYFEEAVAARISAGRVLGPTFKVLGGGLMALGFGEAAVRYWRASRLASQPWDSLSNQEKAELQAYSDPGQRDQLIHFFLDAGAPLTPRALLSKWGYAGMALSVMNLAGQASVAGRLDQDTSYANKRLARLLADSATIQERVRYSSQMDQRRALGLLQQRTDIKSMFTTVDSSSFFQRIREAGFSRGDSLAKVERKVDAARQAWRMVPRTDSLGYEFMVTRFGKTIEHPFQQARQGVSDVSLVAVGGRFDTLNPVAPPHPAARADRVAKLRQEADWQNRQQVDKQIANEQSWWKRALMRLGTSDPSMTLSRGFAGDSADLARDLQSRRQLRARDSAASNRPR